MLIMNYYAFKSSMILLTIFVSVETLTLNEIRGIKGASLEYFSKQVYSFLVMP